MGMKGLPDRAWLDSDELVREALADVRRGRVVSVPSRRYKVGVGTHARSPRGPWCAGRPAPSGAPGGGERHH